MQFEWPNPMSDPPQARTRVLADSWWWWSILFPSPQLLKHPAIAKFCQLSAGTLFGVRLLPDAACLETRCGTTTEMNQSWISLSNCRRAWPCCRGAWHILHMELVLVVPWLRRTSISHSQFSTVRSPDFVPAFADLGLLTYRRNERKYLS